MPVQKGVVFLAMMSSGSHFSLNSTHLAIDDVASVVSVCSDHVVKSDTVGTAADALESVAFRSMIRWLARWIPSSSSSSDPHGNCLLKMHHPLRFSTLKLSTREPIGLIDTYSAGACIYSSSTDSRSRISRGRYCLIVIRMVGVLHFIDLFPLLSRRNLVSHFTVYHRA